MRRLIVLLIWLLPLLVLIILGEEGFGVSPFLVMLILLALFLAAGAFISGSCEEEEAQDEPAKNQASDERIRSLANDLEPFLSIKGWNTVGEVVQFEGLLRTDPADALRGINGSSLFAVGNLA